MEELNRVISELSITDGPGDNISYNKEGPIPISVIHDKETVIRDAYVDMELGLPRVKYDSLMHAIVKQRKLDDNGNLIGTESTNSLVDMRAYALKFIDGTTETLKTNTNAENLLAQVGEEGHRQHLLDEIIDYRRNNYAVHKSDAFIENRTGSRRQKKTTKGWEICVLWKDDSTDWIALEDLKQSYTIQLADFVQIHGIHEEADFAW